MKPIVLALLLLTASAASALDFSDELTPESILAVVNAHRAEAGLLPLRLDSRLTLAAEGRMQDMAEGEWWGHMSPDGTSPFLWLSAADYKYSQAGENLANGFDTARLLVEAWMESPGHRANVLGPGYADCGIAILEGSTRGRAMGKSVVAFFGRRMAQAVATR